MVAATNFGGPPPAWSLNLRADPRASFERDGATFEVVTRLATGDEKADSWVLFDAAWPAFATYRRRAQRPIDVFVLDPT
jgi:deazaflavin-dependent oxidoreductase (nitroreductase family)